MNKRDRRAALFRPAAGTKGRREYDERFRKKLGVRDLCACGKIIHLNRCDAKYHIARLLARDEAGVDLSLGVYRCKACHYWHVGHSVRREAPTTT